jgi:hypothetical protein
MSSALSSLFVDTLMINNIDALLHSALGKRRSSTDERKRGFIKLAFSLALRD